MKRLIKKLKALNKIDNQILLFNVALLSLPLLLIDMCTLQTGLITFSIWCVGITISVIFWRIRTIEIVRNK